MNGTPSKHRSIELQDTTGKKETVEVSNDTWLLYQGMQMIAFEISQLRRGIDARTNNNILTKIGRN